MHICILFGILKFVDADVEELKDLLKRDIAISEDTNHMVHSMRRSARWGVFLKIVWWVAILFASGAAYVLYVQPYVEQLQQVYGQVQEGGRQVQTLSGEAQEFIKNLLPNAQ